MRRYLPPTFAWLAVFVLVAGGARGESDNGYVEIPYEQSYIIFDWPNARTARTKALQHETNSGIFDVIIGVGEGFKYFIMLLQAEPGVTIEKHGLYAPEKIIEISGIFDPDTVQWGKTGDVDASFAELETTRFRAPLSDCVASGSAFAPTPEVSRSKEVLGLFCSTGEAPLGDDTIRAVAASLGIRGYAAPMAN